MIAVAWTTGEGAFSSTAAAATPSMAAEARPKTMNPSSSASTALTAFRALLRRSSFSR